MPALLRPSKKHRSKLEFEFQLTRYQDRLIQTSVDITAPEVVEVQIDETGERLWVNVDGVCVLRCGRIKNLVLPEPEDLESKVIEQVRSREE